jgi:hypothetical protein
MDFGRWMAAQGAQPAPQAEEPPMEEEGTYWLECRACGKWEIVTHKAFENGDTGWYSEDPESGEGLCGGPFCTP